MGIQKHFSSVAHPQLNNQVEAVTKTIKKNLERKLEGAKNAWVEELPRVLWSYRTTRWTYTYESPFLMTYGTKVVVLAEIGEPSFWTMRFDSLLNDQGLALNLDLTKIKKDKAQLQMVANQQATARSCNPRVKVRRFVSGDLLLKKVMQKQCVFSLNSEGLYRVTKHVLSGSYKLEELDGTPLLHLWNANKLRKHYQ